MSDNSFRLWHGLPDTHPSKAACRAMLLGQSSGDQRVKGLAFSRDAVRSGLRSLPGPVVVVKHAVRFARCSSPCGSAAVGSQGGLRKRLQARLGSSKVGGHSGNSHTQAPTPITTITPTTHAQPVPELPAHTIDYALSGRRWEVAIRLEGFCTLPMLWAHVLCAHHRVPCLCCDLRGSARNIRHPVHVVTSGALRAT